MKTALISVCNKDGIVEFAKALSDLGWRILASGGTAKHLAQAGISVTDVAETVGEPILGHRVVTLSRQIHAALLARDTPEDNAELERIGMPRIDLVCVDLYPLEQAIAAPDATRESVIESTDIGGPTILRSAAKGRRIVICKPSQREMVLGWLEAGLTFPDAELDRMAAAAEFTVARYALLSAQWTGGDDYAGFVGWKQFLTYAENRQQGVAGLYSLGGEDPLALSMFHLQEGAAPGYVNLTDVDRLLQTITHVAAGFDVNFDFVPAIALGAKHGNCCGAGTSELGNPLSAVEKMVTGDDLAIFGGVVMVNFPVGRPEAECLLHFGRGIGKKRVFDTIIAPEFKLEAVELLARKSGKCRLLVNPALAALSRASLDASPRFRDGRRGFLKQPNYTFVLDLSDNRLACHGKLKHGQNHDIVLAWAVGSTSNSNTITIVRDGQLIGNGVGQQARVYAANLALERVRTGGHLNKLPGAVAYSDSFFPFPDAAEVLIDAGISAILTSSGSVNDQPTISLCEMADNVTLVMIPDAAGRGFYGH